MEVVAIWRYPVKSMAGQSLARADVGPAGLSGDRRMGVVRRASGAVLSAKREGRLLSARAARLADGLRVTLPDGAVLHGTGAATDEALSEWLGYPVHLAGAGGDAAPTFESQADADDDDSATVTWEGFAGSWADSRPVHLLTTGGLAAMASERPDLEWSVARFRPNVLLDGPPGPLTGTLRIGSTELRIDKPCTRCVMVTRPQAVPGEPGAALPRQPDVLRHLLASHDGQLGFLATVVRPGQLALGDRVTGD